MARRMRVIALTSLACAVATSAASACTSFSTDDGGGTDAGGDERSVPVGDSAVDAANVPDSAPFTSCAMVDATFCDDFDHSDPLTKRWRTTAPDHDASLEVSDARARSAPLSLRILQAADNSSFGALLTAEVPSFVERLSISFDILFVEKPTGSGFLVESQVTPKSTDNDKDDVVGPHLAFYPAPKGGAELRAWNWKSGDGNGVPVGVVAIGQWVHVSMSFAPTLPGRALAIYDIDGTRMTRDVASEGAVAAPSVLLGARSGSSRANIHYDNIVIDAH